MKLRLYKEPYREYGRPDEVRLLFEGASKAGGIREFYLYVWVTGLSHVTAIQAVLNNEKVLEYHTEGSIAFGKIVCHPIGRAVGGESSPDDREEVLGIIDSMENGEFPSVIGHIGRAVRGTIPRVIPLTGAEKKYLKRLLKKHRLL